MGKGSRGQKAPKAEKVPRSAKDVAYSWFDREAHWKAMGYTSFDARTKETVVYWCWVVFLTLVAGMLLASRTFEPPAAEVAFSAKRCCFSLVLCVTICFSLVTDAYRNPPSLKGSPALEVARYLGPYAYFTKHALTIQCAHVCLSFLAEATMDPQLLSMTHAFSSFAAVVAIALTILYLKLNWFEETWQREVLDATNARGINFTEITLVAHILSLPVGILDVLLCKRPDVYPLNASSIAKVTAFATLYPPFYCGITCLNYYMVGHYPYPFMRALKAPKHWIGFCVALIVLLNGFILPFTFFLLRINPTGGSPH